MYTQCPACLSVLSLDVATLARAHGYVKCGSCGSDFDSIATLTEQLPRGAFLELPPNPPAFEPPVVDRVVYRPERRVEAPRPLLPPLPLIPAQPEETTVLAEDPAEVSATTTDEATPVFTPRFARDHKSAKPEGPPRSRERRWPWAITCVLLALVLGSQLAWAERMALIRNPATGNWLRSTCAALGCELPLVAAPEQLRLLASNVQAHPSVANALVVSASIRNDASFAQPYPVLTVSLSDAQGKRIAMRKLQPTEYLDDDTVLQRGMAPDASTALLLEVADPGGKAVGFEFGFE